MRALHLIALILLFCAVGGASGHCQSSLPITETQQQRLQAAVEKAQSHWTVRGPKASKDVLDGQLEQAFSAALRDADPSLAPDIVGQAARKYVNREALTPELKEELNANRIAPRDDPAVRAELEKLRDAQADMEAKLLTEIGSLKSRIPERDVLKEEVGNAYQSAADQLAKTHPDDPDAQASLYKIKSEAGQQLDSESMHELFGPFEKRLEENQKRLSDLFAKTGLASPEINPATGHIDWEATSRKANAQLLKSEPRKSSLLSIPLATFAAVLLLAALAIRFFQTRRFSSVEVVETTEDPACYSTICPHCDWSHSQHWPPVSRTTITCKCCEKSFAPEWEQN